MDQIEEIRSKIDAEKTLLLLSHRKGKFGTALDVERAETCETVKRRLKSVVSVVRRSPATAGRR